MEVWKGYIFAIAMFVTATIQSFLLQYYFHHSYLLGIKLKTALLGLVYEKVKIHQSLIILLLDPSKLV